MKTIILVLMSTFLSTNGVYAEDIVGDALKSTKVKCLLGGKTVFEIKGGKAIISVGDQQNSKMESFNFFDEDLIKNMGHQPSAAITGGTRYFNLDGLGGWDGWSHADYPNEIHVRGRKLNVTGWNWNDPSKGDKFHLSIGLVSVYAEGEFHHYSWFCDEFTYSQGSSMQSQIEKEWVNVYKNSDLILVWE